MRLWIGFSLTALTLAGCTDTADTFPMNDAAKHLGPLRMSFARTGIGSGPVTITMADGEVLKGTYRVAFGGGDAFAFSGGRTASAMVITDGPVQFVATGAKNASPLPWHEFHNGARKRAVSDV